MKTAISPSCGTPPFATLSCLYVFVHVFDADVESWRRFLLTRASPEQVELDAPMVERLAESLEETPALARKIIEALGVLDEVTARLEG